MVKGDSVESDDVMHYRSIEQWFTEPKRRFTGNRAPEWVVASGNIEVYVRDSVRRVGSEVRHCIDIANIICRTPGQGAFTRFIQYLIEEGIQYEGLYVESVSNPRLDAYLVRAGWTSVENNSYYLAIKHENNSR